MPEEKEESGFKKLINASTEIAGGAIGGALGFFAAGLLGAAALGAGGAAIAAALKHVGEEASERLLGPREKARIGGVLALVAVEIQQRVKAGEILRNDGFFDKTIMGRSAAEEVAENVLLKSQREAEEKKLKYMAHLLSSVSFDSKVSPSMAHQLVKAAEHLTYRQLCILKIAAIKNTLLLRAENYEKYGPIEIELRQVLYECFELYQKGLINNGQFIAFGPAEVCPSGMNTQGLGADLFNLMRLAEIPNDDLAPIVSQLK
jgi:hypothetical protein